MTPAAACATRQAPRAPSLVTGKERDSESGLDYFEARYVTTDLGRFMTPDWAGAPTAVPYASYGDPQRLNLYAYVNNNPITGLDPDGHMSNSDFSQMFMQAATAYIQAAWQKQADQAQQTNGQPAGQTSSNTLTYKTTDGGPHSSDWYAQWALAHNSPKGGWIVQDVKAFFTNNDGTGKNGTYTEYWEAFQIPKGGQYVYPHSWTQLSSDDRFAGNYHSVVKAEARFYEGLTLPKSFVSGSVPWAGGLRATYTNPHLSTANATAPVDRTWYTPVP